VILIGKKSQKFQYRLYVGNFDTLSLLQLLEHCIDDVQTPANDDVVLR
jgi:hypothetical protein